MARLSRKEAQERTRARLMRSAAKLFCRHGLERASIDDVAQDAGYTKGAFYANFKSKEELFLAMLDERFAAHLERVERLLETDATPEEQARAGGAEFVRWISADPEWERLFFEFAAYATRNEPFRRELVARYRTLRERLAEAYRRRAQTLELQSPVPFDQLALMTFAMGNGIAFEKLLEPEVVPDELHPTMMAIFFTGLRTLAQEQAPRAGRR
jgi:AcrR family transcriptional regulator